MRPKNKLSIQRRRLRTCLRQDTFIYQFLNSQFTNSWTRLENEFGKSLPWGEFPIENLETEAFILRLMKTNSTITVIRKKTFSKTLEESIHNLMEYDDEAS